MAARAMFSERRRAREVFVGLLREIATAKLQVASRSVPRKLAVLSLFEVSIITGIRVEDLRRLDWRNVDLKSKTITIEPRRRSPNKKRYIRDPERMGVTRRSLLKNRRWNRKKHAPGERKSSQSESRKHQALGPALDIIQIISSPYAGGLVFAFGSDRTTPLCKRAIQAVMHDISVLVGEPSLKTPALHRLKSECGMTPVDRGLFAWIGDEDLLEAVNELPRPLVSGPRR